MLSRLPRYAYRPQPSVIETRSTCLQRESSMRGTVRPQIDSFSSLSLFSSPPCTYTVLTARRHVCLQKGCSYVTSKHPPMNCAMITQVVSSSAPHLSLHSYTVPKRSDKRDTTYVSCVGLSLFWIVVPRVVSDPSPQRNADGTTSG